jgi:hypothetical protein
LFLHHLYLVTTLRDTTRYAKVAQTHTTTHASSSEHQVNAPAAAQDELAKLRDMDLTLEKEVDKLRGALDVEGGAAQVLAEEENICGRLAAKEEEYNGLVAQIQNGGEGGAEGGEKGQLGKALFRLLVCIDSEAKRVHNGVLKRTLWCIYNVNPRV